jgi:hypothetical protein
MLKNLVKMAVPNPGSVAVGSTITLGAAPTGYQSFLAAFGAGGTAFFMLSDGAGRTLGGVWTVNSSTPATATITEILFNLRLGGTAGETFSSTCTAWNTQPAGEVLVPRLGGTITGPLTLSTAPTATLHAATKSYVDTGDAARLPLSGGTLTGALTVQGNVTTTGSVSATGNISTTGSFTTSFSGAATQGQVVFGNAGRRLYFNGGDMWDFNGKVHATGLVLSAGQAVYYEDSQAVWSIWESGFVRFSHQIKTPTISVDWLQNTSGGSPQLKTADGRGIVFQFVDDYANYVRFFRNDGFTNYLMQSPNMRYMDARDWGGTWAMLVQQNDGANQIFFPAAYSDERLKTNIQPTQVDALAALAAVEVVEYDWTEEGLTHARRSPDRQRVKIGVVAQRVQQQIPEMVLHQPEQAATDKRTVQLRLGQSYRANNALGWALLPPVAAYFWILNRWRLHDAVAEASSANRA